MQIGRPIAQRHFAKASNRPDWFKVDTEKKKNLLKQLTDATSMPTLLGIKAEVARISKELQRFRRQTAQENVCRWEDELRQAKKTGDKSLVHRLARRIAGTGLVAKQRFCSMVATAKGTMCQWLEGLKLPGADGGFMAQERDFEQFQHAVIEEAVAHPLEAFRFTGQEVEDARQDMWKTRSRLCKAKKRRACPDWSMPTDIFQMLLMPWMLGVRETMVSKDDELRAQHGVELCRDESDRPRIADVHAPLSEERVERILLQTRRTGKAPVRAHMSQTWQLDKHKAAIKDRALVRVTKLCRLIHGLCGFWKAVYRGIFQRQQQPHFVHEFACGAVPHRRREVAMMSARITAYRLRAVGKSFSVCSRDLSNAFACTDLKLLDQLQQARMSDSDFQLMSHRRWNMTAKVDCSNGSMCVANGCGGFMGDANAPDEFLEAYHHILCLLSGWAEQIFWKTSAAVCLQKVVCKGILPNNK